MPCGGVFMKYAFIDRFIDQSDGRVQKFLAFLVISPGNNGAELFNCGAQFTAVAAVDITPLFVLPDSFLC